MRFGRAKHHFDTPATDAGMWKVERTGSSALGCVESRIDAQRN
jgi:hypothetical protein